MFEQKLPPILKKPEEKKEKAGNVAAPKVDEGKIDPLKVCCEQECERFNRLLAVQAKSLEQLKKAIKGEVVMSGELDKMYQQLINNQVPDIWKEKSYPSLKPLASWFEDFV
jgi:dynein heavy chain